MAFSAKSLNHNLSEIRRNFPGKSTELARFEEYSPAAAVRSSTRAKSTGATKAFDHFGDHRRAAFEGVAAHELVWLMRLLEIARAADERRNSRTGEPSAVGGIERAAGSFRPGHIEERGFQSRPTRRVEGRDDVHQCGFNFRAMLAAGIVVAVERFEPVPDLTVNVERVGVGQRSIADAQLAFLGDHVERDSAVHSSEIKHVVRRVGKNLRIFGGAARRELPLIASDRFDDTGHHSDRVDSSRRCAAMTADAADGYAERHDALVRMRYAPRGRLADPRQPRDWCLAKDLLESRCDQMSALAAHLLTRSEHAHQRSLQTRRIESARRVQAFRYKALHVGGAAAVDSPIDDLELERIALPSRLPVEGDDVHVSGNYQAVGARRSNPR